MNTRTFHKLHYAYGKTPITTTVINFNGLKFIPIPKLIKDLFQFKSPLPKRFSTISFNWNPNKDPFKIPINQKQNPISIYYKNRKNYISPSKSILFNSHIIFGNSRIKTGFPLIIKSCNNTIRSFTSKPSFNKSISPPSNDLKKNLMVDRLYDSSIKQIQMAYDNNYNDFKYQLDGYIDSSSSSIKFFEPHSVSSRSIVLGALQKENSVTIEYWMSGITGKKVSVKAIGSFDQDDLKIKDIIVYWPHAGKKIKIPTKFELDGYKFPTQSPKIFEAEYRDIKKE
ncbi:7665_t:CDS:2 [Diversispora eburnea]|uniref:7665_t:CDS:1 n=1 Tax=Diversispora eburnea TaxID=1213867 RepID=A0A9N9BPR0_9GLOM|nr:7665_t:CDS:2 [Diversispora eburnea]